MLCENGGWKAACWQRGPLRRNSVAGKVGTGNVGERHFAACRGALAPSGNQGRASSPPANPFHRAPPKTPPLLTIPRWERGRGKNPKIEKYRGMAPALAEPRFCLGGPLGRGRLLTPDPIPRRFLGKTGSKKIKKKEGRGAGG